MVPYCSCCLCLYFGSALWDLIVSVPDHCLSFYFSVSAVFEFFTNHSYQVKVYFVDNTVYVVAKVAVCSEFR